MTDTSQLADAADQTPQPSITTVEIHSYPDNPDRPTEVHVFSAASCDDEGRNDLARVLQTAADCILGKVTPMHTGMLS